MRRLPVVVGLVLSLAAVALVASSALASRGASGGGSPGDGIPVVPVNGQAAGHGLKLWVFVYYAKNGKHGPPGGDSSSGSVNCSDVNEQGGFATPFASASPLGFEVSQATVPAGLSVDSALATAAGSWNAAGASLSVASSGGAASPVQDGINSIGWANLVPRRVLAATWAYTDASGHIVEADIFFNRAHSWATLYPNCPSSPTGTFDVAGIATHEIGHALGLNHYSDASAQATMYPSAPSDEIRKVTLTPGDELALQASLNP